MYVAGYNFCENVHADRHCDPRDARLAVHLCTTDGAPVLRGTQPPESKRSEEPMRSLTREEACKRATWCCMSCSMGSGFLTLGCQLMLYFVRAVRRSQTGVSCAARMEMYSGSPSACLCSYSVGFGAKIRSYRLGLRPGCLAQGESACDTGRDG